MKKLITFGFCCAFLCFTIVVNAARPVPVVNASSAVLMDFKTGQVLYAKNPHLILAPASLTKIMTGILALENVSLTKTVTVSSNAAGEEGSSMNLIRGERKTVRDLLWGLLLVSGNDSATQIAEAVSGTEANFARLMNLKARHLGMMDTQFKNASGLPADGHYTSAYDLAVLTRYALQNPDFAYVVSTKSKEVGGARPGQVRTLVNHNKMLWQYKYCTGVKTGYTPEAGGCLITSATYQGRTLIAVVLKTGSIYQDCEKMLNYGFGF